MFTNDNNLAIIKPFNNLCCSIIFTILFTILNYVLNTKDVQQILMYIYKELCRMLELCNRLCFVYVLFVCVMCLISVTHVLHCKNNNNKN